ncbi:Inositol monophosphatase 1 [Halotydeus destructor]|nr:Inositol monophosphatase 1 [Halotydeus destructor]
MSLEQLTEWERFATSLAVEAGKMISSASGKQKKPETKTSPADLVTETDKAIEQFLFGRIAEQYPEHRTIGEESASQGRKSEWTKDPTWIIDPIDGTTNFVHCFQYTCVSIGLSVDRELVLGVIYAPFLDKMYTAKKGCGAFCNAKPIRVRECPGLSEALVFTEVGGARTPEKRECVLKNFDALLWKTHGIRAIGTCALVTCLVAEGSADAFFEIGLHVWDMAACVVIVREAGGAAIDTTGGHLDIMDRRLIVAANESLAKQISDALAIKKVVLDRDCL